MEEAFRKVNELSSLSINGYTLVKYFMYEHLQNLIFFSLRAAGGARIFAGGAGPPGPPRGYGAAQGLPPIGGPHQRVRKKA